VNTLPRSPGYISDAEEVEMPLTSKAERLAEISLKRLEELDTRVNTNMHVFTDRANVRDDVFARWVAEQQCLRSVLRQAGFDVGDD